MKIYIRKADSGIYIYKIGSRALQPAKARAGAWFRGALTGWLVFFPSSAAAMLIVAASSRGRSTVLANLKLVIATSRLCSIYNILIYIRTVLCVYMYVPTVNGLNTHAYIWFIYYSMYNNKYKARLTSAVSVKEQDEEKKGGVLINST